MKEVEQMAEELVENKLKFLPDLPGCYIMKNSDEKIIYIGKAKNLKNRVRSYFRGKKKVRQHYLYKKLQILSM